MDISQVRRKFQKPWDFSVLTFYSIDLSQAYYSLQQESLNSDDMLLYITSNIIPKLEGSLMISKGQKWIVAKAMKEVVNQDLYEYLMLPALDTLTLKEYNTRTNALGVNIVDESGIIHTLNCYLDDYSLKERTVPTAQPVESYQQVFIIAANELPEYDGVYELVYRGINYKIDSFEKVIGVIKIRATENL